MVSIPTFKLSSGQTLPGIGLGFWLTPNEVAADIAYQGLKDGYRLLDSAQNYKNEKGVADGIAKWIKEDPEHNKREDVIFTTKVFDTFHGYEKTKKSLEESLEKTKSIGYIDIVLMHSPNSDYERRHGSWMALQEFVTAGKVKSIGVSNYGIKHLKELLTYPDLKIKPVLNQLEIHPWLTRTELTAFCKDHDIVCEAYSPLTRGVKFNDPDLAKLAEKYGKSPAQILIRWSIQMGYVPLPKSVHPARIASNLDVLDFELTSDEVQTLIAKDEYLVTIWDPTVYPLDDERKKE